jgi:hypothetical protein
MLLNIDLLTSREARLQLLGKYRSGAEAPNELEACFAKLLGAALVRCDGAYHVAIPSSDESAAVHVG